MDLTAIRFEGTTRSSRRFPCPLPDRPDRLAAVRDEARLTGLPAFILDRAGLDPASYRARPLQRRTAACLRAIRAETEQQAEDRLRTNPVLGDVALSTLLIGVSEFFRDAAVFETLRRTVIPSFRQLPGTLRVLSVGASCGAELYSVAMLLDEASLLDRSQLVGLDCRPEAVRHASAAVFPDAALAAVPPHLHTHCFEPAGDARRVTQRIRRQTTWSTGDATRECPRGPWNMVLCRNLAIYLQPEASEPMFRRMVREIAPGGVLVVGKAERPPAGLGLTERGRCIYATHEC
jgi:chemotaxis protein methyltransferase CheR